MSVYKVNTEIYNKIVSNENFKKQKKYMQHGEYSVYDHVINVTNTCYHLANKLNMNIDYDSLVKGALLHDYFLYDWHEKSKYHRLHGIRHPKFALKNAIRDYNINEIEKNMILSHMFPLGTCIPKYKESILLCCVDKYCAVVETLRGNKVIKKAKLIFNI